LRGSSVCAGQIRTHTAREKDERREKKEALPEEKVPVIMDYAVTAEQNLFHPERIIPQEKKKEEPKPEIVLIGTVITDGITLAYIEDRRKGSTSGNGPRKKHHVIRMNDTFQGYKVKEILSDRITLQKGDDRVVALLSERYKKKNIAPGSPRQITAGESVKDAPK
jgi:type II secretory pathway component PulC